MALIDFTTGERVFASPSMSILDASLNAGILVPYSCKTGRCNTCKCLVLHGDSRAIHPELGLTEREKAGGWILSCVRVAESDLLLEVETINNLSLPPPRTIPCRIDNIRRVAHDVVRIILRIPPTAKFEFVAGQYVDVIGPSGIRRSYSLANGDANSALLELHIREVGGGAMSEYWFSQAKINDLLRLRGPFGTFVLRETMDLDLVFLATGTGIAPVKAILQSLARQVNDHPPRSIHLLWGGRNPDDFYLEASALTAGIEYIRYQPVLSRADASWSGPVGYVQDILPSSLPNLSNAAVYACGSAAMIEGAKALLTERGLNPKHFFSDAFVCSSDG